MISNITPITYKDAANLLNVHYYNIRDAAIRGRLTRLQTIGQEQKLIKEQVELFKGKTQIRFTMLSLNEQSLWNEYKIYAENNTPTTQENIYTTQEVAKLIASTMDSFVNMSEEEKKIQLTFGLVIIAIVVAILGFNWVLNNKDYIVNRIIEHNNNVIKMNNLMLEKINNALSNLKDTSNPEIVIETVLKELENAA